MAAKYETVVRTVGGRNGHAESADGKLKVDLALPKELGGNGNGTNPEQLFAAGYAACFEGAMRLVARTDKVTVGEIRVDATVGLVPDETSFRLQVALAVHTRGLDRPAAEALVHKAHAVCPYSKATRGNVDVALSVTAE